MTLALRNTLTGDQDALQPLEPGHVRMYTCGPTVYAPAHVGNFRSFVFADVLRRYLEWSGLRVTWVMNITDVDDKIIRDAGRLGIGIGELTARYTEAFLQDWKRLRLSMPDVLPRATEHIPEMAALIATLLEKGHAYRTDDGSIFFRIASWPAYGRLARLDPTHQRVGERVESDEYAKDDVRDFALWKGPKEGEPSWTTAIGEGRPGWHIECSAMSMRYLGPSFDLHTGGVDLVFPHHEDEVAQSEAATGKPFVRLWAHCAHLQVGGAKMAKREGRIETPGDVYGRGFEPRVLRYTLLRVPYRTGLEYSDELLADSARAVERLTTALQALDAYARPDGPDAPDLLAAIDRARDLFAAAMDDDLNTSAALAVVFDLVRVLNSSVAERRLSDADARRGATMLRAFDRVLAVMEPDAVELPPDAEALLDERATARASKDWARSDGIRQELLALGIAVEDTPDGQRWRKVQG